jgi:hypothetical protein
MTNRLFMSCCLAAALLCQSAPAQESKWDKHAPPKRLDVSCQTCHECAAPTKTDPCLSPCPRARVLSGYHSPKSGPEVMIMGQMSKEYGPVVFSHRIHGEMSEMSGGCYGCHHYNSTTMTILACKECHPANRARQDLSMPDLKGAYHRQCMDCHRQWSKSTECTGCHLKRDAKQSDVEAVQKAKVAAQSHVPVPKPNRVVYETRSQRGSFVTFFHDDHADRFGLQCANCHQGETCVRCHEKKKDGGAVPAEDKTVKTKRSVEELHAACFSCHASDKCEGCHVAAPVQAFDHGRSAGWPLSRFHNTLSCQKCHGEKKRYTKLSTECSSCHPGWSAQAFKHEITGLRLDAAHRDLDCESCHAEKNFASPPTCAGCHDDKTYPGQRPGTIVRSSKR